MNGPFIGKTTAGLGRVRPRVLYPGYRNNWKIFQIMDQDRSGRVATKVGVLDKAMAVLHSFSGEDTHLNPRTVAERTGLSLPTAYRLMQALGEHGLLEKEGTDYRLGVALLHLGRRVADSIEVRHQVLPHLRWLRDRTQENAELHVRRSESRVPVEIICGPQSLRPFVEVGEPLALHVGASGKTLLAWLPPAEQDALAAASAARFDESGPYERAALRRDLIRVRDQGWADTDGERCPGVAAVSAPIFDARGEVAGAVVLSGPSVRLPARKRRSLASLVREAAAGTSRDLGYPGERPSGREAI
ncbi:MAG: helix-turn-helix domain-containing protein [Streptosporangiales bacterium]|nr:helix-turn-helix domain-containing protein [Streptosporangiales bacterium]